MGEGWSEDLVSVGRLLVAYVLGLPVGWEREQLARTPGLRTFPLVALGSCAFVLLGATTFDQNADAQARVLQGLLAGIGFIGGGAILKGQHDVAGVSTAVGVWITAGIGVATAYGHYILAVALSLFTLATLHLLRTPKDAEAWRNAAQDDEASSDE